MALATKVNSAAARPLNTDNRHSDASADNAAVTVTPTGGVTRKINFVTVTYSGAVTKNVTVTLNSGAGAAYDVVLQTIALSSATDGVWIPSGDVIIADDDTIDVTAPAGGVGVTSQVAVYSEVV